MTAYLPEKLSDTTGKKLYTDEVWITLQLTPSCPFFLVAGLSELDSLFSLRLAEEIFFRDSDKAALPSFPLDRLDAQGNFLRLRFNTQSLLIISVAVELLSFIFQCQILNVMSRENASLV